MSRPLQNAKYVAGSPRRAALLNAVPEVLADGHRLFGILADVAPLVVWMTDEKGQGIYLNRTWQNYTGRSFEQDSGEGWSEAVHPDDRADLYGAFAEGLKIHRGATIDIRIQSAAGEYRWFECTGTPHFGKDGEFQGLIGTCMDVHDRKVAEERLQESWNFLNNVVDNLPVALFCKDAERDYSITLWNKMSEELFGFKGSQVLGRNDYEFFPKDQADFFRRKDVETLSGGKKVEIVDEPVGDRHVHTIKVPVKDIEGKPRYLLGISEDITAKKKTEAKLIHASKMSTLGEMAGGIAHEINNPLAIITLKTGQMRAVMARGQMDDETLERDLDKIEATANRIARIIKGLRSFSRSADHDPFEKALLSDIVEDTLELCRERFKGHGISLRLPRHPEITVQCRSSQISQILLNILNNAFDAVKNSKGAWVELGATVEGKMLAIRVTDSGNGIPAETAQKMMQPFFTTKEVGHGTGLGLSIAKGLAEDHGGSLEYDASAPNTTFVLRIPLNQPSSKTKIA